MKAKAYVPPETGVPEAIGAAKGARESTLLSHVEFEW